ncbi:MAG: hypothetical protein SXQ77_00400, partial [Halobacteria archaeon]|nr:hypothetical protein [Halobacteria archaeon]
FALAVVSFGTAVALFFKDRKQTQFVYSIGVILVFGVTYFLPESPPNIIAKLGVGSATRWTYLAVIVYVIVAIGFYYASRTLVARASVEGNESGRTERDREGGTDSLL